MTKAPHTYEDESLPPVLTKTSLLVTNFATIAALVLGAGAFMYGFGGLRSDLVHLSKTVENNSNAILGLTKRIPQTIPPDWFRQQVDRLELRIEKLETKLLDLAKPKPK